MPNQPCVCVEPARAIPAMFDFDFDDLPDQEQVDVGRSPDAGYGSHSDARVSEAESPETPAARGNLQVTTQSDSCSMCRQIRERRSENNETKRPQNLAQSSVGITLRGVQRKLTVSKDLHFEDFCTDKNLADLIWQARNISESEFMRRFMVREIKCGRHLILLVDQSFTQAFGFCLYRESQKRFLWIEQIAVLSGLRGRGLGKILMQAVIARAVNDRFAAVQLGARATAISFYRSCGFEGFVGEGPSYEAYIVQARPSETYQDRGKREEKGFPMHLQIGETRSSYADWWKSAFDPDRYVAL